MKNRRAAIYVRCSTVTQNLEVQFGDLRRYAEAKGLTVVQEFQDFGISGAKDRRPGLDEMMKAARKRKFDVVLVWRLDRLGRNTKNLLTLIEELESLQIYLVSHQEGLDLQTSIGRVVATVLAALAMFEHELIRERVVAGIQNARENGKKLGRPRKTVDVDAVRQMIENGLTYREIAQKIGLSTGKISTAIRAKSS